MKLITALATPYFQGNIDKQSYKKLLLHQQSADSVLVLGTTGEGAFLSDGEKKYLVTAARKYFPREIWVGISCGMTSAAINEGIAAKECGAEGLLVSPPAFFKCTEEGFIGHISAIYEATHLPIMLYNAPSRCGYCLWQSAIDKLSQICPLCLKDAGSQPQYPPHTNLPILCGNEERLKEFAQSGVTDVVSVVSNVLPNLVRSVAERYQNTPNLPPNDDVKLFNKVAKSAFCEINPIAVKYMLYKSGIFADYEMRLPLTRAAEKTRKIIDEIWEEI